MSYKNLEVDLKLKKALPEDLKEVLNNQEKLRVNFSIFIYNPQKKWVQGPVLLNNETDVNLLALLLKKELVYIPISFYKTIPEDVINNSDTGS